MMLMTKEIKNKMPKLRTFEMTVAKEIPIAVKFFTPDSNWTWYATEGEEQEDGDWLFFGYVDGFEGELGYFTLNELKRVRGQLGLPVERDRYFGNKTLEQVMK